MTGEELMTIDPGELARILKIPVLKAYVELEVRDKDGKVIERRKQESRSWTRWAYNTLFCNLACVDGHIDDNLSMKDTGENVRSGDLPAVLFRDHSCKASIETGYALAAAAGIDITGIVVGTGTAAESFEGYQLATQIADGTGAGELSHVQAEDYTVATDGTTKTATQVRYFNNNSGAEITVNEVALYVRMSPGAYNYMTCRDLVSPGVAIPNTGQLKVTYTIELEYPA